MDQVKIGRFIASLRHSANLTQEQLGEKIGVTNKTVSRWENGNYMPDIEMLQLLSKQFHVSINELLAGERIPEKDFREKADENIVWVSQNVAFSFEERKRYFKQKWRREHMLLLLILWLIPVAVVVLSIAFNVIWSIGFAPLIGIIAYGYQHNKMMVYVENRLYH